MMDASSPNHDKESKFSQQLIISLLHFSCPALEKGQIIAVKLIKKRQILLLRFLEWRSRLVEIRT
jgi:hypothetical protein